MHHVRAADLNPKFQNQMLDARSPSPLAGLITRDWEWPDFCDAFRLEELFMPWIFKLSRGFFRPRTVPPVKILDQDEIEFERRRIRRREEQLRERLAMARQQIYRPPF